MGTRILTPDIITNYEQFLQKEERAPATVEKYVRDIRRSRDLTKPGYTRLLSTDTENVRAIVGLLHDFQRFRKKAIIKSYHYYTPILASHQ